MALDFRFSDVPRPIAARYRVQADENRRALTGYWGDTFGGEVLIDVKPDYAIAKSLTIAWAGDRGRIEMPSKRVIKDRAATTHELVHVYAPNHNRFLAEGLAVFLQQELGTNPSFPNFGRPLDPFAAAAPKVALGRLDAIATPERLRLEGEIDERDACAVAGSFVGYLIGRFGLDRFRDLYSLTPLRPGEHAGGGTLQRYATTLGAPLDALEQEWRAAVKQL